MKIIIAPDSFKDSLSATDAAHAMAAGFAEALPEAEIVCIPMADGGEGTLLAVLAARRGELRRSSVSGPLGAPVMAHWGWLPETRTAVIEMAEASGIQLVEPGSRNACYSSSYGTGELICTALDAGALKIVLAIGGSATNDGGSGMMRALGLGLYGQSGAPLGQGGAALSDLGFVDVKGLDVRLQGVQFEIAADVDNPLCGVHGASQIFGPQKGATPEEVMVLDDALANFADHVSRAVGKDDREFPGSGAAGGMGYAAKSFLNASFRPGVEVVSELVQLATAVRGASLVVTGEGRFDRQTLRGKTPFGVAQIAKQANVPVVVIAGTLGTGYEELYEHGVLAAFSLADGPLSLEQACSDAKRLLRQRARDIGRLLTGWQPFSVSAEA